MSDTEPFIVTLFEDYAAAEKREQVCTLCDLADKIRNTTAPKKDALPWVKLARFGNLRTLKRSLRHDANVLTVTGIEADYDGEAIQPEIAIERLTKAGVLGIAYASPSHSPSKPRWRVLCPTSQELPPERRAKLMGRLNGLFQGIFARESWTLSQAYYFGSVNHNPAHLVELIDGDPIDLHDDLDEIWLGPPGESATGESGMVASAEARGDAELVAAIVTGAGFHVEMCALSARYVSRGMKPPAVVDLMSGLMLSHPEAARDSRWAERYASIPALVASAVMKYAPTPTAASRSVARAIMQSVRDRRPPDAIRATAIAAAERHGLPEAELDGIVAWAIRKTSEEIGGKQHA